MGERISALDGNYTKGIFGKGKTPGIQLIEVKDLILYQVAVWPNTLTNVGSNIAKSLNLEKYPEPNFASSNKINAMLRVEPLKWWIVGKTDLKEITTEESCILDISHSKTCIRISGHDTTSFINRFLPIDLRESSFPVDAVASTVFHHVSVTLWRSKIGYELFIPRAFALSLWEILKESAAQFGYEIQ